MDLNKLMMDFLAEEGFRPHETPFGIAFKNEGFNFLYFKDEEDEQYYCEMDMDEDDYVRLVTGHYSECPYFVNGDEYKVVRHQM